MTDVATAISAPQYVEFHSEPPTPTEGGGRSWSSRGQNYVLDYVEAKAADLMVYDSDVEHVLIVPDDGGDLSITFDGQKVRVTEAAVIVLPRGTAEVATRRSMRFIRLADIRDARGAARAVNNASYQRADPRVAGVVVAERVKAANGPEVFLLSDHPPEEGRFGTMFQSETFLVNLLPLQEGPRDPEALSPHHHDDFEQCSLALDGEWVHHLRTPWGPNRNQWREDEHRSIGSPSVTIIPPPMVHTSEAVGQGMNRLVDIFCPVRRDFIDRGWVLNAGNYSVTVS